MRERELSIDVDKHSGGNEYVRYSCGQYKIYTRPTSNKYNPDSRQALALVHYTPLILGGLDMTHTCLIHVVRALEGHETELGALTDANRRRDFN